MESTRNNSVVGDNSKPPPYSNLAQTFPTDPTKKSAPTTVIIQQMHPPCYGPKSQNVMCSSCKLQITTKVKNKVSFRTHVMAYMLCLLGCWSCCLIPYCVSSCQNQMHTCPHCDAFLGIHKS